MYNGNIPHFFETYEEGTARIQHSYTHRMKLLGAGCVSLFSASAALLCWDPTSLEDVVASFSLSDLGMIGAMTSAVSYVAGYALFSHHYRCAFSSLKTSTLETHLTRSSTKHILRRNF